MKAGITAAGKLPSPTDTAFQLLRTVGAVIGQRRERLLGISWQDFSISVVVETTQGQRQIDVFRPDNVYDLWVRMYLRRDNRALSTFLARWALISTSLLKSES